MAKNATKNKAEKHVSSMREMWLQPYLSFVVQLCSELAAALLSGES